MIRVGESWQARNGHRRWVSMPLHDLVLLGVLGWWIWPAAFALLVCAWSAWICAECVLLVVSGAAAMVAVGRGRATWSDVTVVRLRWHLHIITARHPGG